MDNLDDIGRKPFKGKSLRWTDELIGRFWNYHSRNQEKYFTGLYGDQIISALRLYVPKGARVLDYACGAGGLTGRLLEKGFTVAACDYSEDSVEVVRNSYEGRAEFIYASTVDQLLTSNEKFDVVVLIELIEHLDDEKLAQLMSNVRHVLSPGGTVIMTTPNDENLEQETVYCPCCDHSYHRWQHVRSWSDDRLRTYLVSQGLENVTIKKTDFSLSIHDGFIRYWLLRSIRFVFKKKYPHLMCVVKLRL